ncbi:MAG: hypothetical protein ACK4SZ_15570 [Allosphingosinicella sp.]|uniref:hypothetical protein n=1 Tax=Allosphingosinicella sp. TaxID=2823234 RepID=UPI00394F8956
MSEPISKIEGASRQLDTAIDLYFDNADSLSAHALAFAAFKVLFDLYPHHQGDGFAAQIDAMISKEGWRAMSGVANFLKHADRDPDALLRAHHPEEAMSVIGLATLLYRRIAGDFSPKMRAFDIWIEQEAHDALGIEEIDGNEARAAEHKRIRDSVRALPHEAKMVFARRQYHYILENFDRFAEVAAREMEEGLSVTDMLDSRDAERKG